MASFTAMLLVTLVLGLLSVLLLVGVRIWSAPSRGKQLAKDLGLPRPAVIAHRGASYLAPEATRPAYLLARELGADYLELDLQRTRDEVLIALHDRDLLRTTNVREVFPERAKDPPEAFTFAELHKLDVGSWFNARFPERARASFTGVSILRLEEILDIAEDGSNRPGLFIEMKTPSRYPGIERQLVETLTARGWIGNHRGRHRPKFIFASFEPESLALLKELAAEVPAVLLIDEVMMRKEGWDGLLRQAQQLGVGIGTWGYRWARGPDWSVQHAPRRYVTTWPRYTGAAHRAGLLVYPWAIDARWEMWMAHLAGADGIFTNRPDIALAFYGRPAPKDLATLWKTIGY